MEIATGKPRAWLNDVQSTLNDAHMLVTDSVHNAGREFSADEIVLLERIDNAILHCQSMRVADRGFAGRIRVVEQ